MNRNSIGKNSLQLLVMVAGVILLSSTFAQFAIASPPTYENLFKATCGALTDTQTGSVKFTFFKGSTILGTKTITCIGSTDNDSISAELFFTKKPNKWVMEISIQDTSSSASQSFSGNKFSEIIGETTRTVNLGKGELSGVLTAPLRV